MTLPSRATRPLQRSPFAGLRFGLSRRPLLPSALRPRPRSHIVEYDQPPVGSETSGSEDDETRQCRLREDVIECLRLERDEAGRLRQALDCELVRNSQLPNWF